MALSHFSALLLASFAAVTALSSLPTTTPASLTPGVYVRTAAQTDIDYRNISSILATFPEFTFYNSYLALTRVADEINSALARPDGVTCLVLPNPAMSALTAGRPLSAVKASLRGLTLLHYYDPDALRGGLVPNATLAPTLLLQTTPEDAVGPSLPSAGAPGGMIITVRDNGFKKCIAFRPSAEPGDCSVYLTRPVAVLPEDRISILEVTSPAAVPRFLDAALPPPHNFTAALEDAQGCGAFVKLLAAAPQAVIHAYEAAYQIDRTFGGSGGLTVFVPNDEAFRDGNVSAGIARLSHRGLAKLLLYHAVREYYPEPTLRTTEGGRVATLLSGGIGFGGGVYDIGVTACGDDVCLETVHGGTSRVTSTVLDSPPLCILAVDSVLVPADLFNPKRAASAPPTTSPTTPMPNATRSDRGATNSSASSPPVPAAATRPVEAHNATIPVSSEKKPPIPPPPPPLEEKPNSRSGSVPRSPPVWTSLFAAAAVAAGVVVASG